MRQFLFSLPTKKFIELVEFVSSSVVSNVRHRLASEHAYPLSDLSSTSERPSTEIAKTSTTGVAAAGAASALR